MTKKKKIILGTIAGLCIAAVISVAAYGMILYLDYIAKIHICLAGVK